MLKILFQLPIALFYRMVVCIRHRLFDWDILKSKEFDIPIIVVGNLTVGGTGKTPVTEFLIEHFMTKYNVAVLSRGYKRRTKGFRIVDVMSPYRDVGDEPKQMKIKYPNVVVAVCEKRVEGIEELRKKYPDINLIILDDAFQHRYVESWVNILLMDYNRPVYKDHFLPWGRLRDSMSQLYRAHFVLVTKCPENIKPLDCRIVKKSLGLFPYQQLYFSRMISREVTALYPDMARRRVAQGDNVIVLAGIANPAPFVSALKHRYRIKNQLIFEDHHSYRVKDIVRLSELLKKASADTVIITTEKDAVKLINRNKIPVEIQERLFYMPIHVALLGNSEKDFVRQLEQYVRTNQKYSMLHPE